MNFRAMLAVVRKIVVVLVALVVGLNVIRWTGEAFREYAGLFLLLLAMMVLATGVLARSVGKLPCRGRVKVIWLGLVCYLSFVSLFSGDIVRDKFGQKYVPGYYSYYDCEDATPDNPCFFSAYRVNGHLSPIIEGFGLLYIVACIACPWAAYRLWRNAQTNIETHYNDAQNAIKAARLRTAAEQGNAEAQEGLGFFYCIGAGVPRDYVQAATWFRKAAEQGNAEAQYRLGLSYYKGEGVPKDYAQAEFWWRKAAEQGEDTAQYNLKCLLHYKGEDVPQDYAQDALWYRKAAEQGDARAQYNLGELYEKGQGVPQDYAQAAFWWRKSAEQGHAYVQFFLGDLYHHGQGVPQDDTQAAAWWRKAAEQGFALAQYHLGLSYDKGLGVPQDYAQAALWYRKAAEQGVGDAQCMLGAWYGMGQGVPQDYAEAYFWSDVAAAGKLDASMAEAATTNRDLALSHLTPANLAREQERVRKWFEAHQAKPQ